MRIKLLFISGLILISSLRSFAETNPCEDPRYLELKAMDIDSLSERQYDYLKSRDELCQKYLSSLRIEQTSQTQVSERTERDMRNLEVFLDQRYRSAGVSNGLYWAGTGLGYVSFFMQLSAINNRDLDAYFSALGIALIAAGPKTAGIIASGAAANRAHREATRVTGNPSNFSWGLTGAGLGIGILKTIITRSMAASAETVDDLSGIIAVELSMSLLRDVLWGVQVVRARRSINDLRENQGFTLDFKPIIGNNGTFGLALDATF